MEQGVWDLPLWHETCQIRATFSIGAASGVSRAALLAAVLRDLEPFFDKAAIEDPIEERKEHREASFFILMMDNAFLAGSSVCHSTSETYCCSTKENGCGWETAMRTGAIT